MALDIARGKALERELMASDKFGRATMAALISALTENCTCETCQILRDVSKDLKESFKPPGKIKVRDKT
jgi:hypothetical protein